MKMIERVDDIFWVSNNVDDFTSLVKVVRKEFNWQMCEESSRRGHLFEKIRMPTDIEWRNSFALILVCCSFEIEVMV